ncbi:peptide deformylase [Allokutzneria sp. A3M-2-11 16]|nr:peptide deformylase [Allokutzneria sp. A3M-2-11 16]
MPIARARLSTDRLQELAEDLVRATRSHGAFGVAAPQLGVAVRMIALNGDRMCQIRKLCGGRAEVVVHCDPEVVALSDEDSEEFEGCLSVPRIAGVVRRRADVRYRARTLDGEQLDWRLIGRAARVVSHELDHLDGILFLDRAEPRSLCTFGAVQRLYQNDVAAARASLGFTP